jgi:hypothetical protein
MSETVAAGSGTTAVTRPRLHGLCAEFAEPAPLLEAARSAHAAGYRRMDAYSPFPVEGLSEAVGQRPTRLPLIVLIGGLVGAASGYSLAYWCSAIAYPLNVGGRPYHSWPSFIPVTFETTVLAAAFAAVFGMLALNGLPMPYHPLFHLARFELASRNRFFLCIEARDPRFDVVATRAFLLALGPLGVYDVPA